MLIFCWICEICTLSALMCAFAIIKTNTNLRPENIGMNASDTFFTWVTNGEKETNKRSLSHRNCIEQSCAVCKCILAKNHHNNYSVLLFGYAFYCWIFVIGLSGIISMACTSKYILFMSDINPNFYEKTCYWHKHCEVVGCVYSHDIQNTTKNDNLPTE